MYCIKFFSILNTNCEFVISKVICVCFHQSCHSEIAHISFKIAFSDIRNTILRINNNYTSDISVCEYHKIYLEVFIVPAILLPGGLQHSYSHSRRYRIENKRVVCFVHGNRFRSWREDRQQPDAASDVHICTLTIMKGGSMLCIAYTTKRGSAFVCVHRHQWSLKPFHVFLQFPIISWFPR